MKKIQTSQQMFLNLYVNPVTINAVKNICLHATCPLGSIRIDVRRREKYPPANAIIVKRFTAIISHTGPILRNVPEMFQI